MPLYTDGFNAVIVQFGRGDIAVLRAHHEDEAADTEIILAGQEPHPIGVGAPELIGRASDSLGEMVVRLCFDNVASLDVLIGELQVLRAALAGGEG